MQEVPEHIQDDGTVDDEELRTSHFNKKKLSNDSGGRPTIIVKDHAAFPDKPMKVNINTDSSKELPPT